MKRKKYFLRLFALLALMLPWTLQAQNAKVSEYDGSATTATYASIASTGTAWTSADQTAGYVDVSMPFAMYFGETQIAQGSTLRVFPNGSASFTSLTDSRIAPLYYSSGYTTTATSIYTKSTSSVLTVEWRKVVSGSNMYSFQMKLYSGGDIEFCYGPMTINSSINVFTGLMSSSEDVFRARGEGGTLYWNTLERATDYSTRTLSLTHSPEYNTTTNQGVVYTFTQPACVKPTSASATATAWNSIDVEWTVSSVGNGYVVKYSTNPDFNPDIEGTSKTVNNGNTLSTTITGLAGSTTYYIYVRKTCSGAQSGWSPMTYATTPSGCPALSGISSTNVTASSATLFWTTSLPASGFSVRYNLGADFDPTADEGTLVNATDTSKTITGLTGASTYYYYVRANCVSGLTTNWYGPYTFNTSCGAITVNADNIYTQNFAGTIMPSCWSEEVVADSYTWSYHEGYAVFPYNDGAVSRLITPIFNFGPGAYQVDFYHAECDYSGTYQDSLLVYYRTSATGEWVLLEAFGNHANYSNVTLSPATILLPNINSTYQLAFEGQGHDGYNVYLSNVVVRPQPTCPNPTALAVNSQTNSSVTLSWTETGSATAWQIAYGQFTTDDDYVIVNANTNPFTVTGLTAEQTYYFYVRSYCASNDQSEWIGSVSATPTNAAVLTVNDGTTTNEFVPVYGYYVDNYSRSQFIIPASELTTMQWGNISKLTFYSSDASVNWGNARFNVYMAPTNATTLSSLVNWNDLELVYSGSLTISDGKMEITLDNPYQYIGGNLMIGINQTQSGSYVRKYFYGVSATGASLGGYGTSISQKNFLPKTTFNYIAGEPVTCFKPNGLTVSNVTSTTADLTWNEMGASTQWEVKVGARGFNPDEAGTSYIVNGTPTLSLDYLFMVSNYDAYVRAICNPEGPTEWSAVCEFKTSCPNGGEFVIGEGTVSQRGLPSNPYYNYSLSEQIFTPSEIGGATNLSSVSFYVSTAGATTRTVDVYLSETDKTAFTSTTDWVPVTDMTKVVNAGSLDCSTTGWKTLEFDVPFAYSGNNNLMIVVDDNTGGWKNVYFYATAADGNKSIYVTSDGTNYDPTTPSSYTGTLSSNRSNIKFGAACDTGSCNAPHTVIALSETEYAATLTFTDVNEASNPTYGIVYGPQGFNPETAGTTVSPINANSYTISNLTQTTSYDVYVYAICSGVNGRMVKYNFVTPFIPNCKTPIIDGEYGANNITYNTATFTWRQPGDMPQFWTVRYSATDFNPATAAATDYTELTIQGTNGASAQLTGLVAGTTYYVYVKATCSTSPIDESPWSAMSNANPAYTFTTPTCDTPEDVVASNVTNSTAMIHWTSNGTAWSVKYGLAGFDLDNEGITVTATADSIELTGLDAYTTYDVYVKNNCTATDESDWSSPVTFRTVCPDGGDLVTGDQTGTNQYLPLYTLYNYSLTEQIYTVEEMVAATTISSISYYVSSVNNDDRDPVDIYMCNTDKTAFASTTDWVSSNDMTLVYSGPLVTSQTGWQTLILSTPFYYDGTNLIVAVDNNDGVYQGTANFGVKNAEGNQAIRIYSDDINYDAANPTQYTGTLLTVKNNFIFGANCNTDVTCFAPASVSAVVADNNNVTVTWSARNDLRPIVNNFEMKYGLEGFNPETSGTLIPNLNNVFNYIITAELAYDQNYDVYVRTVCGDGDYSNWTKASFTTNPSCWAPSDLTVTATTQNSATLSWTENTPVAANRWEVAYGMVGFDPDRVTPIETTNNSAFVVNGLKHTTNYEFYVRAKCSGSDVSPWSNVATGTTQCGVWQYDDMPLVENFDGYTGNTGTALTNHVMPNCWNWINGGTSYAGYPSIYSTASYANSTPNSLRFYTYTTAAYADQIAILPEFGFGLDTVDISLYGRFYNVNSSIQIGVMSDPTDAETFELVETLNAPSTGYNTQRAYDVSLKNYTGSGHFIAFKVAKPASGYNGFYMDDLTVKLREKVNVIADNGGTLNVCNEFMMPDTSNGGYHNNVNATYVIRTGENGKVAHVIGNYDLEYGYDFLRLYRGGVNANNLVAVYTGNGSIDYMTNSYNWVDSGYVTLVFTTDGDNAMSYDGFKLLVQCECPQADTDAFVPVEANGSYTWNGVTYNNNIVRTGLSYNAADVPMADPDLYREQVYTYVNVAGCDSVTKTLQLTLHPTYNLTYDAAICDRDVFGFYGEEYSTTGSYTVNGVSVFGADSVAVLNLQVNPAPSVGIYVNGQETSEIENFCDNFDLTLLARSNTTGATFVWDDESTTAERVVNPHESNSYNVVATAPVTGCTSLPAVINVTTTPVPVLTINGDAEICFGQSATLTLTDANEVPATYRWSNGATGTSISVNPTETTVYTATATSTTGACVATAEFTVVVNQLPVVTATASVAETCTDSLITLAASEVEGYSYSWNTGANTAVATTTATSSMAYKVTVIDQNGCQNEFNTQTVTVYPSYELSDELQVCFVNNPYTWGTQVITADGNYDQNFRIGHGCDSLVHLSFTFQQMGVENSFREVCEGTPVTWGDQTIEASETGTLTYIDNSGECPVQKNLFLTVNYPAATEFDYTVCDSYTWPVSNETYTESGAYPYTLATVKGCDSVVTMNLTVNYQNTGIETVTACDSYVWDLNGVNYTASTNEPVFTLQNQWGCDSVVTLNLTVNYHSDYVDNHCVYNNLNYVWVNGRSYNLDVTENDNVTFVTGTNDAGCDDIAHLVLSLNPVTDTLNWVEETACDEYEIVVVNADEENCSLTEETMFIRESGDYELRIPNATIGHDQWKRVHLTVNPSSYHTTVVTECLPYTWIITGEDGNPFEITTITAEDVAGAPVYNVSVNMAEAGYVSTTCSNIEVLRLTPKYSTEEIITATICQNGSWEAENGVVYYGNNLSTEEVNTLTWNTTTNEAGCQHQEKVALTVNPIYNTTAELSFCESEFVLNETTGEMELTVMDVNHEDASVVLTIPGELNDEAYQGEVVANWQTELGCDSVVTISYTVNPTIHITDEVVACHDYVWDVTGVRYVEPGNHSESIVQTDEATGCNVVRMLDLTLNGSSYGEQTIDVCTSYEGPDGETYRVTKTFEIPYTGDLEVSNGCDSITRVTYNVINNTFNEEYILVNQPYTWRDNVTYTENVSGIYHSEPSVAGCDDVYLLHLTVVDPISICEGNLPATYTYGNTVITLDENAETGVWNSDNNDTIIAYTILRNSTETFNVTACNSYVWNANNESYTTSGEYSNVIANAAGCDSTMILNLTVNYSNSGEMSVVACDSYTWTLNGETYTSTPEVAPTYTLTNADNCDSVVTLNLTINSNSGAEMSASGCVSYTWNNPDGIEIGSYTESGDYTHSYTDANGCVGDSVLHLTINPTYATSSTIVVNDSAQYLYNGVLYTAPYEGTFSTTFASVDGCDSVHTLTLIIPIVSDENIHEIEVTACGSYTWTIAGVDHTYEWISQEERMNHGMALYKDVTFNQYVYTYPTDTTFDASGAMQSVDVLHLNLMQATYSTDAVSVPLSLGSYTINDVDGNAVETVDFTANCVQPRNFNDIVVENVPVGSVAYCNDYRTYTIHLIDNYDTSATEYICADATTYTWNDVTYTVGEPGHTYYFTQVENEGLMTVLVHTKVVYQRPVDATTVTVPNACDSYTWTDGDGETYTESGTYVYNYTNSNQCAASMSLVLTVNASTHNSTMAENCDKYIWVNNNNSFTYTVSGTYFNNYVNELGCPSADTLHLTIKNNSNQGYTASGCDSYTWELNDNQVYTTSGDKLRNYTAENGCPSVDTLHLTINHPASHSTTETVCDSVEWNNNVYYATGTYYYNYNTAAGCASVDTLYLTVNNATHQSETLAQCDSYEWNGQTYTASSPEEGYVYSYTNEAGCQSSDTLHLTINVNNSGVEVTETACDEFVWDINDRTYNTSGTYTARTSDENGCVALNTLNLTINHSTSYDSVLYISDGSYQYTNQDGEMIFYPTGVYNFTELYTNADQCDSTLNITLHIGTSYLGIDNVVNCNEYTWRNGETYVFITAEERDSHLNEEGTQPLYKTVNGTYIYYNPTLTIPQQNDYDSIYMLALTLTQSFFGTDELTLPISLHTVSYGDVVFNFDTLDSKDFVNETRYFDVHFDAVQYCDSVINVAINLVNNYQEVTADRADICVTETSYTWRGHTISTATNDYDNTHTYYIYDDINSDNIVEYITVVQHPFVYATERRTACDSYTWNGNTYTESTSNATAYFPQGTVLSDGSSLVCDSTVTLILTINHNTSTTYDVPACETYTWTAADGGNGETYTESGIYTFDYNTAEGCPSTNTLNLTINHNSSTEYMVDACDSYVWTAEEGGNGNTYTASNDYSFDYNTAEGCPSTNTLHLTIRTNSNQTFSETACDSYTWNNDGNGETYTESGVYYYEYTAENGCPSTNTLNLTVNVNGSFTTTVTDACNSYTWHGQEYTVSGSYTYDFQDANNCASVETLELTVNASTIAEPVTVIECESYTWTHIDGTTETYTASSPATGYVYNYTNADGCPSSETLILTIGNGQAYGLENVTNCGPYTWVVNGETIDVLTESMETSTTVVNPATGCDSTIFLTLTINPLNVTEATICNNADYVWDVNNTTYTVAGTYDEIETDDNGNCISNERLILTVNRTSNTTLTTQVCLGSGYEGDGFSISAEELPAAGEYSFTNILTNESGCDSIVKLIITVGEIITNPVEAVACDSYDWNAGDGETYTYTASGVYNSEAYANALGCATIDVLTLTINQNAGTEYSETVCDVYMWNGTEYNESGDYTFDYVDGNGCPSTDVLHLTVNNSVINEIVVTACDSYTWENGTGETYTTSGVRSYSYTTADNCNGTDYLVLTINTNSSSEQTVTACDKYVWNGTEYTESGDYAFDYETEEGCPSTDVLHLTVNYNSNSEQTVTACESYSWYNTVYTESGDYTYNYYSNTGCPSTDVLHLTVNYNSNSSETVVACTSYEWNNDIFTTSGTRLHNYVNEDGCASVDTLYLTINTPVSVTVNETACESFTWENGNGETYTTSGARSYTIEGGAANGCDSIVTLNLTINNGTHNVESAVACNSYTWNNDEYTTSGVYVNVYTNEAGCQSADTLHLTINNSTTGSDYAEACSYYNWNGNTYNQSGTYTHVYTAANGCDSVVTLTLTIGTPVYTNISETFCGSYNWNGQSYTQSGSYTQSFTAANGCDSVVTLTLTVNQALTTSLAVSTCESYTWDNSTYTTSGNYSHTYTAVNGCDSVVTLFLTIKQPVHSTLQATACDSYVWNGTTYNTTGSYSDTFTAANGCDSIVTLNLTVNQTANTSLAASACNSYAWNGASYTATGVYTQNFTTVNGCDSIVTLNLTILPNVSTAISQTACQSYTWNNETYTQSGIHTYTYTAANGCDSIVTLSLTIAPAIQIGINVTACDSYTWEDVTYTTSGNYPVTHTASNGCDSIVTLNLTINNSVINTSSVVACDSYTWEGNTYTQNGVYTHTYTGANGCDSVQNIVLTLDHSVASSFEASACGSYTWNNETYDETGIYTQTLTALNGCDSVVTLNLTINGSTISLDSLSACDSYTWINGVTYTQTTEDTYITTNANGCDSIITLKLTVNYSTTGIDEITECDGFIWIDGVNYTASTNEPTFTLTSPNGCDSVVTLHLTINNSVEQYETLELNENQLPYTWRGNEINAAGEYEFNGYTVNGCDSTVYLTVTVNQIGIDVVSTLDDVKVYPNPTRGKVTVTAENVVKVEVLDIVGRLVATFDNTNTFDLSNLGEGAYTLRITLPEGITVRKVVKK